MLVSCVLSHLFSFYIFFFFFFSSRRRHTRSYGDWSSDVCSFDRQHVPAVIEYERALASSGSPVQVRGDAGCSVRSEERRVGKECRCRWSGDHVKRKKVMM